MGLAGYEFLMFGADDWGRHPSSAQHLARVLCQKNRVLWVDSVGMRRPHLSGRDVVRAWRKVRGAARPADSPAARDGVSVLVPLAVPFHGSAIAERVNRWLVSRQVVGSVKRAGMTDPVLWFTSPMSDYMLDVFRDAPVIYYIADDYAAHYPDYAAMIRAKEARLLARADLVLVASDNLHRSFHGRHPSVHVVPHGVDFDHFAKPHASVPEDLARVPRPRVGYVGLIRDLIDLDLFSRLAERHPEWSLVLIGDVAADIRSLLARPNVYWLGRKEYRDLPGYLVGLDVGLVPYRYTDVTFHCNPLKLREYLAAGIPVVSYDYPAVRAYGDVIRVAGTRAEFEAAVAACLRHEVPEDAQRRRDRVAGETWERIVEDLAPLIQGVRRPEGTTRRESLRRA